MGANVPSTTCDEDALAIGCHLDAPEQFCPIYPGDDLPGSVQLSRAGHTVFGLPISPLGHPGIYSCTADYCFSTMASNTSQVVLVRCVVTSPSGIVERSISRDLSSAAPLEVIDDTPYSWAYTGRHDGGALPPTRNDTMYGHVLNAVMEAKGVVDAEIKKFTPSPGAAGSATHAPAVSTGDGRRRTNATKVRHRRKARVCPSGHGEGEEPRGCAYAERQLIC